MDPVATMERVIDESRRIVDGTTPEQLGNQTLCSEWTVRDVLNHAIHDVQVKYDQLLATIKTYDPHKYLATLDAKVRTAAQAAGVSVLAG